MNAYYRDGEVGAPPINPHGGKAKQFAARVPDWMIERMDATPVLTRSQIVRLALERLFKEWDSHSGRGSQLVERLESSPLFLDLSDQRNTDQQQNDSDVT